MQTVPAEKKEKTTSVMERRKKSTTDRSQALQFKSILEQPIGRMWFPSLGNVPNTSNTQSIPMVNAKPGKVQLKANLSMPPERA